MSIGLLPDVIRVLDHKVSALDGYVQLSSTGAVVSSNIKGVTVSKTGTGQYTFAINNPGYAVKAAFPAMVAGTAVDLVPQLKSQTNTAVVVQLLTGATPTNPSAACGLNILIIQTESTT